MGVRTTNIDTNTLVDEVIGNRDGSTVRQTVSALGQQLVASGPLAARLGEIDTAINDLDATTAPQAELDELDTRVGTLEGSAATQTEVDGIDGRVSALEAEGTVGYQFAAGGPVAVATTANIALSGEQTIDGVLTSTSRVLVRAQTDPAENGIYVSAAGAWARSTDMDVPGKVGNTAVFVSGGSTGAAKIWITYSEVTTLGTDGIDWIEGPSNDAVMAMVAEILAETEGLPKRVDLLDGLLGTQLIGVSSLASGPATGAGTYALDRAVAYNGRVWRVRAQASAATTLIVRRFTKSGSTYTQIGADVSVALATGANSVAVSIPVLQGEYLGWYEASGRLIRVVTAATTGYHLASGNQTVITSASSTTSVTLQIGFDLLVASYTGDEIAALKTSDANQNAILAAETIATQVIGNPGTLTTGSGASAGTLILDDVATHKGILRALSIHAPTSGQITVYPATLNAGVWTPNTAAGITYTTAAGLNDLTPNMPLEAGQGIAIAFGASDLGYSVARAYGGGYTYLAGAMPATITRNVAKTLRWQVRAQIESRNNPAHQITLANATKVAVIGDSIVEGKQALKGKSWPSRIGEVTDFQIINQGVSGDKVSEGIPDLQNNILVNAAITLADRAPEYAIIAYGTNDAAGGVSAADMADDLRQMVEIVRQMGAQPIIMSPHTRAAAIEGFVAPGMGTIYQAVADQTGAYFVDTTSNARRVDTGTQRPGFFDNVHPGTRTLFQIVAPVLDLMCRLPVTQGIKVHTVRPTYTVSTIQDLLYQTPFERAERFKEMFAGGGALKAAAANYVDDLNLLNFTTDSELINSEYAILQNGGTLAVSGDYTLVEVVFPALARDIQRAEVTLVGLSGATVYVPDVRDGLTTDKPTGAWRTAAVSSAGVVHLPASVLRYAMQRDKLPILIHQPGGIAAFGAPSVRWWGARGKPALPAPVRGPLGAEALSVTDVSNGAGWTQTGTPTIGAPADGMLPLGSTGRAVVTASAYLSQAVTWTADNTRSRTAVVEVLARAVPAIQAHAAPDGALTADTFDWRRVDVGVTTDAGTVWQTCWAGLWWQPVTARINIPLGSTGCTLAVRGGGAHTVEVARASMKIEV